MSGHVGQVFLDFMHFGQAKARLVRLVIHFEVLDLLEVILRGPSHRLVALFLTGRGFFLIVQIYSPSFLLYRLSIQMAFEIFGALCVGRRKLRIGFFPA